MVSETRPAELNPLAPAVSDRLMTDLSEPVLVMVTVPVTVSPGFMLVRLKIAAFALLLDCVSVPAVTALAVLPVVDENVAPEPTARAPAAAAVASGRRTILVVEIRIS